MLREEQIHRYARHIVLGEVGAHGQEALLAGSVTMAIGERHASSHCGLVYLAAAGVGSLVVVGDTGGAITADEVSASLAFTADDIGRARLDALTDSLTALNPDVSVRVGGTDDQPMYAICEHADLGAAMAEGASVATRAITRITSRSAAERLA